MQPSLNVPTKPSAKWMYASLSVRDGDRFLKPTHLCGDFVRFVEPPLFVNPQIEIILRLGETEQRNMAAVLPHDPQQTQIPIRLMPPTAQ
ncbi:MAG TPA: hypothetical protein VFE47_30630 [Tepidisphaeraceae bacterium]|jgi:hypothetical protein|nr:hypothetical protein [Tepidisphaeraceae bacterium]